MPTKKLLIIALVTGALISSTIMVADTITAGDWLEPQLPGISAAYLFWGAVGSSVPVGMAICWLVNAVVYAAPVFAILMLVKLRTQRWLLKSFRHNDDDINLVLQNCAGNDGDVRTRA